MTARISSFCSGGDCVAIGWDGPDLIAVRDTKNLDPGLRFTTEEWEAFLLGVKNNEFDLDRL